MEIAQLVALYGALIGTVGTLWHVRNWWFDRPHIKVKLSFALAGNSFTGPRPLITLSAVNKGKQMVQLTAAGFEVEDRKNLWFTGSPPGTPPNGFPHDLYPGTKYDVYFSMPDLVDVLVKDNDGQIPRRAWFNDATDKTYYRKVNRSAFHSWVKGVNRILDQRRVTEIPR